jgi:hypothetical protein
MTIHDYTAKWFRSISTAPSTHYYERALIIPYLRWLLRRADKPVMPESPALLTFVGFAARNVAESKHIERR